VRRPVVLVVVLAVVFAVGVAVGEALNDNPAPGGSQTLIRTLEPIPFAPGATATVTVTTSSP